MKELCTLFLAFARIGACTFGGGYAMLPMLEREIVNRYHWATSEDLLDYFAIGQCTPGIIAVNTATLVGYKCRGVWGGIAATLGVIFPSIVIILAIAMVLGNFMHMEAVAHAFAGIRIAVCALIAGTVIKLSCTAIRKWWQAVLAVLGFVAAAVVNISTIYIVLATIAGAVLCFFFLHGRGKRA